MSKPLMAGLAVALLLGGCGGIRDSRINPFNWFGQSQEVDSLAPAGGWATTLDNRALVAEVTELAVERFPGGAIIRAEGLPPTQGWWDAELVALNDGRAVDGVLTYEFRVAAPRAATRVSTPQSRAISAAVRVSDRRLDGVGSIVVRGAQNARSVRR